MLHAEYTMLMSLVLDGEETEAERARLQEHLRSCDACALTWQRWRVLDRRLALAPMLPVPLDLAASITVRLDARQTEEARRRWFMFGLALAWSLVVAVAVMMLGVANGWHIALAPDHGPLAAALSGLSSMLGWIWREMLSIVIQAGAPTIAATTGILLCVTCGLVMAWLWLVARLTADAQGALTTAQ